jgi:hypothetical protein
MRLEKVRVAQQLVKGPGGDVAGIVMCGDDKDDKLVA